MWKSPEQLLLEEVQKEDQQEENKDKDAQEVQEVQDQSQTTPQEAKELSPSKDKEKEKTAAELEEAAKQVEELRSVLPKPVEAKPTKPQLDKSDLSDEKYEELSQMSDEQLGEYMAANGAVGVLDVTKLMKRRVIEAVAQAKRETIDEIRVDGLKKTIKQFKTDNADLFSNPVVVAMIGGLDRELLKRAGYKHVKDLDVEQLTRHLTQLEMISRKTLGIKRQLKTAVVEQAEADSAPDLVAEAAKKLIDKSFSLSDIPAGDDAKGTPDPEEMDGLELEEHIRKLSKTPGALESFLMT